MDKFLETIFFYIFKFPALSFGRIFILMFMYIVFFWIFPYLCCIYIFRLLECSTPTCTSTFLEINYRKISNLSKNYLVYYIDFLERILKLKPLSRIFFSHFLEIIKINFHFYLYLCSSIKNV